MSGSPTLKVAWGRRPGPTEHPGWLGGVRADLGVPMLPTARPLADVNRAGSVGPDGMARAAHPTPGGQRP